jgi:hypothetical protein
MDRRRLSVSAFLFADRLAGAGDLPNLYFAPILRQRFFMLF